MKKKLNIGLVGCGAIAQNCHLPGYAASGCCELTAVADPRPEAFEEAKKLGFHFQRYYSDYREMFEREQFDAVSVCTPNKFHAEVAIRAAAAGCHVIQEKPIAISMPDAYAIRDAVKFAGKNGMTCFTHRFSAHNRAAKKMIEKGAIGEPYMIRVRFAHTGPFPGWAKSDWFYNPEMAGGGALMDMAVHAFDIARRLIGRDVTAVTARIATLRKQIAVDDNVIGIMEFGDRCLGYIECGWTSPAGFLGIEIMGDNGAITCDYCNAATMTSGVTTPSGKNKQRTRVISAKNEPAAWGTQMAYVVQQTRKNAPYSPSLDDGADTLAVVLAAYESGRTGKRVEIHN
ncbi:Myo-inositol 2-dehydrogenase [bioreactor metagenome]|uniref:Myo-inositol 2-dehydrogenase n=1 Tax=bioreactor metagenome TaxID=1076179 RepID=A0A645DDM5_9ZZZZ